MTETSPKRYVVQYRDASSSAWGTIDFWKFDRPGDALERRDLELEDEPDFLPKGRHRAVDMETGAILEWRHEEIDRY
jgi:hypothetical protein